MSVLISSSPTIAYSVISSGLSTIYRMFGNTCYLYNKTSEKYESAVNILEKLDIENTEKVIKTFMNELKPYQLQSEAVNMCVISINETILEIEKEIEKLKANIIKFQKKWFKYYRSVNCENNIARLKDLNHRLDIRYKHLMECLKCLTNYKL